MFLRYMNENKAINLDNFDYICIDKKNPCKVLACRAKQKISISFYGGFGPNDGDGHSIERVVIKQCDSPEEAEKLYTSLQYNWINRTKNIFEVE